MKYLIKAVTTNNRDLRTALLFTIEDKSYLFNCPDGFQRVALSSKMKFKGVRYVFLSGLQSEYYAGLPGFYLSTRETYSTAATELQQFKLGVFGPKDLRQLITKGKPFYGGLNFLEIFEYGKLDKFYTEAYKNGQYFARIQKRDNPNEIISEEAVYYDGIHTEETKQENGQEEEKKSYEKQEQDQDSCHEFQDNYIKIIPVKVYSTDKKELDSYTFICIPKQSKGKFIPKKAVELGADPKFHFRILNEGNPVTLANGNIIYPFQVMEEQLPSQSFIFVFIPNINYLQSFLSEENKKIFEQLFIEKIDQSKIQLQLIYHSVSFEVFMNKDYKEFMSQFGPNVQHVVDCDEVNDEVQMKVKGYQLSTKHSMVCPSLIPLSPFAVQKDVKLAKLKVKEHFEDLNHLISEVGLIFNLYPLVKAGIEKTQVITANDLVTEEEEMLQIELNHMIKSYIKMRDNEDPTLNLGQYQKIENNIDDSEPSVLFLGTSSMKPTTYRGASAIHVFIKGHGILMDSAEGSYGQLYDHFQKKEVLDEIIRKLRVVFITHIHGDHQLGILRIMAERDKLLNGHEPENELFIVTPEPMWDYMIQFIKTTLKYPEMVKLVKSSDLNPEPKLYYDMETPQYNPKMPHTANVEQKNFFNKRKNSQPNGPLTDKAPVRSYEAVNQMIEDHQPKLQSSIDMMKCLKDKMNITHMNAIEVNHCIESYACLFGSPDFGRIFYSGDTMPCQTVLNYAQNVKLLIHEATFEDALEKDALCKKHTTVGQAIEIAKQCKPWRTVLTHFSPRYQKVAEIDQKNQDFQIMMAFDHLRFKLSHLEWAYKFLPIYKNFFFNESDENEVRYEQNKQNFLNIQKDMLSQDEIKQTQQQQSKIQKKQ